MKFEKIYSFIMLLLFGWGVVTLQASPSQRVNTEKVSERERFTLYQIRERIDEVKERLVDYKEDKYLMIQFDEEIEDVQDKLEAVQSLIETNRLEGQLYSSTSMRNLSNRVSELNRAFWVLESQS